MLITEFYNIRKMKLWRPNFVMKNVRRSTWFSVQKLVQYWRKCSSEKFEFKPVNWINLLVRFHFKLLHCKCLVPLCLRSCPWPRLMPLAWIVNLESVVELVQKFNNRWNTLSFGIWSGTFFFLVLSSSSRIPSFSYLHILLPFLHLIHRVPTLPPTPSTRSYGR